jgi:phosphatidylglycerophosphate synthase
VIQRARLAGIPAGDGRARVAGLPVLLRQLLSLQEAGITDVAVEGGVPPEILRDQRLGLRIATAEELGGPPMLTARPGLVWHPDLPKRLARQHQSVDLERAPLGEGEFVVPTETAEQRRTAEALLSRTLFKPTDGIVSRALNRHLSLRVSRVLLNTPVTPNQMTVIAALFGFAAIGLVLVRGSAALLPGALLLQVQSILDGCDGEISRLKYLRSRIGEWLDQIFDDLVNVGYFAAVGIALSDDGSAIAGPVTIAGVALHLIYQAALYTGLVFRGGGSGSVTSIRWWTQGSLSRNAPSDKPRTFGKRVADLLELAVRRDFFTFLYLPCALAGASIVALVWSGVIFVASGVTTGLEWIVAGGPRPA